MKFDNKIESMLANGKLTAEQAVLLKTSLKAGLPNRDAPSHFHTAVPLGGIVLAVAFVTFVAVIMALNQGDATHVQTIQNVSETLNQPGKVGEMNKTVTSILSVALISLPVLIWFSWSYNSLVSKEEDILSAWAQVETNYQRRADLIPNLVKTVKGFMDHESSTLTEIAKMRAQLEKVEQENTKVQAMAEGAVAHLNDENYMTSLAQAQQGLGGQMKGLMATVEAYPTLRSSDQFLELQAQIEGTENRIGTARMAFNEEVGEFNAAIRKLPGSLVAGLGGFQRKAYFKADDGTNKATQVDFNDNDQ